MLVSRRALGYHPLSTTVSQVCKSARITGYKTNHLLRATSTSRLYQSGVDEQLVIERSGHRSTEGVRSYKRTSDEQRCALSDMLNSVRKTARTTIDPSPDPAPSTHSTVFHPLSSFLGPTNQYINCTLNFSK